MKRLPYLLPQHLLSKKHVFEGFDATIELVDRASAEAGFHSPVVVNTSDLETDALGAWLSAIASCLFLAA
jgi:hypothetical protein